MKCVGICAGCSGGSATCSGDYELEDGGARLTLFLQDDPNVLARGVLAVVNNRHVCAHDFREMYPDDFRDLGITPAFKGLERILRTWKRAAKFGNHL